MTNFYTIYGSNRIYYLSFSYEGYWHQITCIFERENYDDLAVKAVTGSYENYWHLMCHALFALEQHLVTVNIRVFIIVTFDLSCSYLTYPNLC